MKKFINIILTLIFCFIFTSNPLANRSGCFVNSIKPTENHSVLKNINNCTDQFISFFKTNNFFTEFKKTCNFNSNLNKIKSFTNNIVCENNLYLQGVSYNVKLTHLKNNIQYLSPEDPRDPPLNYL